MKTHSNKVPFVQGPRPLLAVLVILLFLVILVHPENRFKDYMTTLSTFDIKQCFQ